MEISIVLQSILIITFMILIGALLAKRSPLGDDTRGLFVNMIVNVAMPCIILSSIFNVDMDEGMFQMIAIVFGLSILINLLGIGMGAIFVHIFLPRSNRKRELALLSGLGNTGFIGIPLCAALIGPEGALFAAVFDAGIDVTVWTVGVAMLQKNRRLAFRTLKAMVNMPTMAVVVGLIVAYFNVKPPMVFIGLADQLAALAAPLAMFYIGMMIMALQRGKVRQSVNEVWVPILVKLFLLPIVAIAMINFFEFKPEMTQTVLIQSMMPTMTMASILFAKYSADEQMGALTTIVSTLLALITIPFMIYIMSLMIQ